jgi:hypothetical protein
MAISLPQILKEWLKSKQGKRDAIQGWSLIESAGSSVADRSFKEVESLRLRYRLERINQKLFQVYQSFGKKVMDHWASVYPLTEEERKREVRRIHLLLEEQKKITDQIHELKEPTLSLKEVLSKEEKQP